jgi:hypothetical protein
MKFLQIALTCWLMLTIQEVVVGQEQDPSAVAPASPTESASDKTDTNDPPESVADDATTEAEVEAELETAPLAEFDARSIDEIWTISSRHLCSPHSSLGSLAFRKRIEGDTWSNETAESFLASSNTDKISHTVIFIHGNRTPMQTAIRRGLQTYDQTFLEWKEAPSVRFVIWLWPADQIRGQIRDVREKAGRADMHAFHLARLMTQMPQDEKISLIGYSFGGRLAIGSMHLLGEGCLCGSRLPEASGFERHAKVNVTLVAAAIRNDCFVSTRNKALVHTNHLFSVYNSEDQYLRFYKFAKFDGKMPALGYTGIAGSYSSQLSPNRIRQFNAVQRVGTDHDYLTYIVDQRIEKLVQQNLFFAQ